MKTTPWFSGKTQPARDGVYERKHRSWGLCYSRFHLGRWKFPGSTPDVAATQEVDSDLQREPWRGLAEKPNR